jgi:hypothetical protein
MHWYSKWEFNATYEAYKNVQQIQMCKEIFQKISFWCEFTVIVEKKYDHFLSLNVTVYKRYNALAFDIKFSKKKNF